MNNKQYKRLIPLLLTAMTLTACGGSDSNNDGPDEVQNQAPTAMAGDDVTVNEQTEVTLTGSGTDSDGTIASYSWTQTAGTQVSLESASTDSATFTSPTIIAAETLDFQLTVTDNDGSTATDTVSVTVNPVNTAPIADSGSEQTVHTESMVTLTGNAEDSDGEIVQYQWTQTAGDTVTINQADQATATFSAPASEQTLTFELTVTDNEGAVATDTVAITTEYPHDFDLLDSQQQATEYAPGTLLRWSVENYDPEVQVLTWQVTSDSPLHASTYGSSQENPHEVEFTTLQVAQNTDVTIQVNILDGNNSYTLSKTITMLAAEIGFSAALTEQEVLSQIGESSTIHIADANNDSFNDIIYLSSAGIKAFYGAQNNIFSQQNVDFGQQAVDFSVVDINGDNLKDLLLTYGTALTWSANLGNNSFGPEQNLELPEGIVGVSANVGDLDNDNDADIAVVYKIMSDIKPQLVWFEKDADSFKAMQYLDEEINPWDHFSEDIVPKFTLGDYNNDGKTDIMVATSSTNDARPTISYLQTDDGFNKAEAFFMLGNDSMTSVYTDNIINIDINQDGYDDIITWQSGTLVRSRISTSDYYINQKDGTFSTTHLVSGSGDKLNLFATDIDNDGDLDIITTSNKSFSSCGVGCTAANVYAGHIGWIENLNGTMTENIMSESMKMLGNSDNAMHSQVGDLDNDGDIDVINVNAGTWIYENKLN